MISSMTKISSAKRTTIALAVLAVLAGGGLSAAGILSARASTDHDLPPRGGVCLKTVAPTVLDTLEHVAVRVYHEGVSSERTAAALYFIKSSIPLREAIERGDAQATRAAARALVATGHMTNLEVLGSAGAAAEGAPRVLADIGGPDALAPLHGTIIGASGVPIATFLASVWADNGFISETEGLTEGAVALRENGHSIAGSFALPPGKLPAHGELTDGGVAYLYTSFPAAVFPTGSLRIYLLRSISSTTSLCGQSEQETLVHTLSRIASLIYAAEDGSIALKQLHRVQHDSALLEAVAARDEAATREAILGVLHAGTHVVRMRVLTADGGLLSDVGGPDVLAPVRGPLRLHGHTIGSVVLSIQDDLGYRLLAQRLAGLSVVMYKNPAHPQVVMSSFRISPTNIPTEGKLRYQGQDYRVFTLHAEAFPSGPLRISVLIPIPYS
jgi:hypothetical protein